VRIGTYELAANVSLLFTEHDYLDRFAAAKAAGFTAVESWWPFPTASPGSAQVAAMIDAIEKAGVRLVGLNFFAGDMPAGERGVLSDPDRRMEFAASLAVVQKVAERTGCPVFNALYGTRREDIGAEEQDECARANLTEAMSALPESATVVLEALTIGENGNYPLTTANQVVDVIEAVGGTNLAFLFDTYHLTNNGADLVATVRQHAAHIGHVQLADSPGRNEPGTGSVDFAAVIAELTEVGYQGVLAAEYRPKAATIDGLGWIRALGGA
jgi:hydroxypyruvate isomerase